MTRREALRRLGAGFGSLGLAHAVSGGIAETSSPKAHFPAKAEHVIYLFLNGGLSHIDSFDPKPLLSKRHGEPMPGPKKQTDSAAGNLMGSPWSFRKHGRSGIEVSEIFSQVGACIDDFCVIRSTYSDLGNHGPSLLMMNSGHSLVGRPSMGSWITYGLGTEYRNLPGFIVLCPGNPVLGPNLWTAGFLPRTYQGAYISNDERTPQKLIPYLRNEHLSLEEQRQQLELLSRLNDIRKNRVPPQSELDEAIRSMEVAFRMQMEAPDIIDITGESEATLARYGENDFGRGCLLARRLIERGVRMVQVYFGNNQPWDSHDDIRDHAVLAKSADPAIAALVTDLKNRGLLEKTLVIVGSEFGRAPMVQNSAGVKLGNGRDHNVNGFSTLLAGGGIRGGVAYGSTDEFGWKAIDKPVHVHDLHATILHLLGLDHTRLTYRFGGRDFRLTDVYGSVIKEIVT